MARYRQVVLPADRARSLLVRDTSSALARTCGSSAALARMRAALAVWPSLDAEWAPKQAVAGLSRSSASLHTCAPARSAPHDGRRPRPAGLSRSHGAFHVQYVTPRCMRRVPRLWVLLGPAVRVPSPHASGTSAAARARAPRQYSPDDRAAAGAAAWAVTARRRVAADSPASGSRGRRVGPQLQKPRCFHAAASAAST